MRIWGSRRRTEKARRTEAGHLQAVTTVLPEDSKK